MHRVRILLAPLLCARIVSYALSSRLADSEIVHGIPARNLMLASTPQNSENTKRSIAFATVASVFRL